MFWIKKKFRDPECIVKGQHSYEAGKVLPDYNSFIDINNAHKELIAINRTYSTCGCSCLCELVDNSDSII